MEKLEKLFGTKKPIIGMIHLAGHCGHDKINRVLEEVRIYEEEGISGVIIENYHGDFTDLTMALKAIEKEGYESIVVGVNYLMNPRMAAFSSDTHGGKFIQIDSVQGDGFNAKIDTFGQFVLGGVGFKYQPKSNNLLRYDLREGMERCDAIVTTGDETSISKLVEYKRILKDFPLIVRGGLNVDNIYEQLKVANGAIVGNCFKFEGNTRNMIERDLVRELMDVVLKVRE